MYERQRQYYFLRYNLLLSWLLVVALTLSPFGYALPAIAGGCGHSEDMSTHDMHEVVPGMAAHDMATHDMATHDMAMHDMATDHVVADTGQDRCCCCDCDCGHTACDAQACGAHVSAALHELTAQSSDYPPLYLTQLYSSPHLKVPPHSLFKPPRPLHM